MDTKKTRIVVTRRIPDRALALLRASAETWVSPHDRPLTVGELHDAVAGASAVIALLHDTIDDALLDAAGPDLRIIANVAVGYDNLDLESCARRGVIATNTPGVLTEATADIAFALILMSTRRLGEAERLVRTGTPWSWSMGFHLGSGIQGKTLGIVGLGQIGQATARRARAHGMNVVYSSRRRVGPEVEDDLAARFLSFDELIARADVVSLHCPLTAETRRMVDASVLSRMKATAFLINTTRGQVVDESALVDARRDGTIAGAGLDVYEHEPIVHPGLLEIENVTLLPHLGSSTIEARAAMAILAARNVVAVLSGEAPLTPISGLNHSRV